MAEMECNGEDQVGEESQALLPVAVMDCQAHPSMIQEPDEQLVRPPELHLHQHQHLETGVDTEARIVVDRLATQYGDLFNYFQCQIRELKEQTDVAQL